jgi:hypothetical protein
VALAIAGTQTQTQMQVGEAHFQNILKCHVKQEHIIFGAN